MREVNGCAPRSCAPWTILVAVGYVSFYLSSKPDTLNISIRPVIQNLSDAAVDAYQHIDLTTQGLSTLLSVLPTAFPPGVVSGASIPSGRSNVSLESTKAGAGHTSESGISDTSGVQRVTKDHASRPASIQNAAEHSSRHSNGSLSETVRLGNCGGSFLKEIQRDELSSSATSKEHAWAETLGRTWIPSNEIPESMGKDGRVDTCALVSSGGGLKGSKSGKEIDKHDLVFRMNAGGAVLPLLLPEDAGRRTNILVWNHPDVRRKCFYEGNDDIRRCVPHALFPGAMVPKERMQFLVAYLKDRDQMTQMIRTRKKLGQEAWRLQVFDRKYEKILPKNLRSWANSGWGASAGMMAFWIASTICRNIDTYGFKGTVSGHSYHAYAWCDVDKILKVETSDCKNFKSSGGRRLGNDRSEFGFQRTMTGHNFNAEKRIMEKFKTRECLQDCFAAHCK